MNQRVKEALEKGEVFVPAAPITTCPIEASLGLLGKKWSLIILRDIGMRKRERFNELMGSLPGISPRVLSRRLQDLENHGILSRVESQKTPKKVRWKLTEKGWDALPILMSYVAFGSKWYPEVVFPDGQPRTIKELYPAPIVEKFFINLDVERKDGEKKVNRPAAKW